MTPREWREESVDDRALMLAFVLFEGTLEARRSEWREEKEERRSKKGGDGGTFSRMKQRMQGEH
jgi:hypothetical protein